MKILRFHFLGQTDLLWSVVVPNINFTLLTHQFSLVIFYQSDERYYCFSLFQVNIWTIGFYSIGLFYTWISTGTTMSYTSVIEAVVSPLLWGKKVFNWSLVRVQLVSSVVIWRKNKQLFYYPWPCDLCSIYMKIYVIIYYITKSLLTSTSTLNTKWHHHQLSAS